MHSNESTLQKPSAHLLILFSAALLLFNCEIKIGDGAESGGGEGIGPAVELDPNSNAALPAAYNFGEYTIPEHNPGVQCGGGSDNDTATIKRIVFGQTHLHTVNHPFFFLIADRPALLQVSMTGSGPAPDVRVEGFIGGQSVGSRCLAGPEELAETVSSAPNFDEHFSVDLPAEWMQDGLSLSVTAGSETVTYSSGELNVGPAPEINFLEIFFDTLNYNDYFNDQPVPADFPGNLAGALPISKLRMGTFPVRIPIPELVVTGATNTTPVVLKKRLCEGAITTDCQSAPDVPIGHVNAAVLNYVGAIVRATGDYIWAVAYGHTGGLFPGGWGGGRIFVSEYYDDVTIHELGHALSLPHWSNSYGITDPQPWDRKYPYGGEGGDGGGRGSSWNLYQNENQLVDPTCRDAGNENFGLERSDGMQRSVYCIETRSDGPGPWDGFGDFSAITMFRWLSGAEDTYSGTVPYRGGQADFFLSSEGGFPNLRLDADGNRQLIRTHAAAGTQYDEEKYPFRFAQEWEVPVYLVYGVFSETYLQANIIHEPIRYSGSLPDIVDPTDPETFNAIKTGAEPYGGYFYFPKDTTLKFTYEDGTEVHAVYVHGGGWRDVEPSASPWRHDTMAFAMTVPANKTLVKVELYHRMFVNRGSSDPMEGNINNPSLGITAANYMDDARLTATWEAE